MPHTKQQIRQLLEAQGRGPVHRWGQNFLIDLNLMRFFVDAANINKETVVLEVGCGTGSLTSLLVEQAGAVIAVEIDPGLAQIAQQQLAHADNLNLVQTDVLAKKSCIAPEVTELLRQKHTQLGGRLLLVANLPYQVASPLMINLLLGDLNPDGMFMTVQAEVAERMQAQPGTKAYGLMSILLQSLGTVEILRYLKPDVFWPQPDVQSAMVAWRADEQKGKKLTDRYALRRVIEALLGHRRKKAGKCLQSLWPAAMVEKVCDQCDIDPDSRGETLPVEKYIALANALHADKT